MPEYSSGGAILFVATFLALGCGQSGGSGAGAGGSNTGGSSAAAGTGAIGGAASGGTAAGGRAGSGGNSTAGGAGGAGGATIGGAGGASTAAGSIVPLYSYPTASAWDDIVAAKGSHPTVRVVAIINPNSGPGTSRDATFATGAQRLADAGIVVAGYVATGYGARDAVTAVEPEIDAYATWYPAVTAIFFDEQANDAGNINYYMSLDAYAKAHGFTYSIGNPGTDIDESLVGVLDTMLIYESKGLPSVTSLGGWHATYPPERFGIIPYGTTPTSGFVQSARAYVGYVYVTDDDLPNPWDTLSGSFDALLADLE